MKDVIYVVPHTHYDAVWVFTKEDYFYINIDFILKRVVEILEEYEDYKFLIEQTFLLEEIENRYPELFEKIRKFVREGRIEIADGEYLMADTMLPQEETLVREILVGKRYVREKFGKDVEVMWQADSFGLNAQLPQIYRKSGYKYVAFRRGCPEIKPSEFLWEGLDGTRIIAHVFPLGYRAGLYIDRWEESYQFLKECAFSNHILMPSGSGSTPPQEEIVEAVRRWNETHEGSEMKIATPIEFFKEIEKIAEDLPVRKGEMYSGRFSPVFPDTASSRIWIKLSLRRLECDLLTLERFDTIYHLLNGGDHKEELDNCWKKILFNAFHDILPGTGADEGYTEVRYNIDFLRMKIPHLLEDVLRGIVESDSDGTMSGDMVVFNPLPWEVENWVEVDLSFDRGYIYDIRGVKCGDEERKVELIKVSRYYDGSIGSARIGFVARVPAMGYKVYKLIEREPMENTDRYLIRSSTVINNRYFRVNFNPENGVIMVSKGDDVIVYDGNEIVVDSEAGDLYHHYEDIETPVKTEGGEGIRFGRFKVDNLSVEETPLRVIISVDTKYYSLIWPYRLTSKWKPVIWKHNYVTFHKKVIIYRDLPRIDFVTVVENRHPRTRIRVRFKTNIDEDEYVCDMQFGAIRRRANTYYHIPKDWVEKPSGVYPTLRWMDYGNGRYGVTVMNRGNPENEVRDGCVYITLLRSVDLLSHGKEGPVIPVYDATELNKRYEFRYSIYPHEGDWKDAKSYKMGYEFNYDLIALQLKPNGKYRPERCFLWVKPENVVLTALKMSEDGDDVIVRVYEATGEKTRARIEFFRRVEAVRVVNLLEEYSEEFDKDVSVDGNGIEFEINPFEIVTLRVRLGDSQQE